MAKQKNELTIKRHLLLIIINRRKEKHTYVITYKIMKQSAVESLTGLLHLVQVHDDFFLVTEDAVS